MLTDHDYDTKERAVLRLVELYSKNKNIEKLKALINFVQPIVLRIKKSKTSKLMREILDTMALSPGTLDLQIELCRFIINWCKEQNKNFVRHKIEIRLGKLLFQKENYRESLQVIESVLQEARDLDNKHLLVEIQLIESKVCYAIQNFAKSKSALTACKVAANAIYCAPLIQAEIDSQCGIVNAEDLDFKTAYSYFFESFEAYQLNSGEKEFAIRNLQYMILCKIMTNSTEEVQNLLNGKYALRYPGRELNLMKRIAAAHKKKSLIDFQQVLNENKAQIEEDKIIAGHVSNLYENLKEQNLMKIVEPYSRIEISYISEIVGLDVATLQKKLSEMILDKKFDGTLDQGHGHLIIFDTTETGNLYPNSFAVLENMNNVVDKLFDKANQLKYTE